MATAVMLIIGNIVCCISTVWAKSLHLFM